MGDVEVRGAARDPIEGALVPRLIDELPVIAVLATQAEGVTEIHDAAELRAKEFDRIADLAAGLNRMGARCETLPDGLVIEGPTRLAPAPVDAAGDHRLAMAFAVAAGLASAPADPHRRRRVGGHLLPGFFEDSRPCPRGMRRRAAPYTAAVAQVACRGLRGEACRLGARPAASGSPSR